MATSPDTDPPRGPDGTTYGTPPDRPVAVDDCNRFDVFLSIVSQARTLIVPGDNETTMAALKGPLTDGYGAFDYVLATAQPAVWHDALAVTNWLYALAAGKPVDDAVALQALANVQTWRDANCDSLVTTPAP